LWGIVFEISAKRVKGKRENVKGNTPHGRIAVFLLLPPLFLVSLSL
jgi:hypothetical protein